jgi:hypothetical protein
MRAPRLILINLAMLSIALPASARRADGQELRGVVRDSASRLPIPGAVVSLLDSTTTPVARTTTNERGQFRAVLLGDGVRRVRVVRLGFRPADARLPAPSDGVIQLDVVMVSIPLGLLPVQVTAGPSCPRRRDRALALALLEQARAGLLATVVARSDKPARMMRLRAIRTMEGYSDRIVHQRVRIDSAGSTFGSFGAARSANDLVRNGFTADSAGLIMYFGPDADVLLDDRFADGYCFHLMDRDAARANQIGLGFRPASRRNGRIDVDGALWIDTVARALVDIEYRYLGVDSRAEPFGPGGRISFRAMPNGVVVIDRWTIRIVGGRSDAADVVSSVRQLTPSGQPIARERGFYGVEVSGELARATWPDGVSWAAPLGTLHLKAVDADGKPAPGTVVRLADTDYEGTADSTGAIELPDLVPGPYAVSVVDPELVALGITIPTPLAFVAARRWTLLTRLPVLPAEEYVSERCRTGGDGSGQRSRVVSGTVWLLGRVTAPNGQPIADAKWTLRYRDAVGEHRVVKDADVGPDGVFQYCELPRGERAVIDFRANRMAETSVSVMLTRQPTVVNVRMKPR